MWSALARVNEIRLSVSMASSLPSHFRQVMTDHALRTFPRPARDVCSTARFSIELAFEQNKWGLRDRQFITSAMVAMPLLPYRGAAIRTEQQSSPDQASIGENPIESGVGVDT
jgi:hypothetical protein